MLTKNGKKVKLISIILPHIPIQKLSKESAIAKKKDSFKSITLELSISEEIGLLKILEEFFCFLVASKKTYIPIKIKIKLPINLVILFGKILCKKFPKNIEQYVINKEVIKRNTFPILETLVLFIPYVIPIPSESILLDSAKTNEFNIIIPLIT